MDSAMMSRDATVSSRAGSMLRGSRDFYWAFHLLTIHRQDLEVRAGRMPSPFQSRATCAALALELAFKARLVLDGASERKTKTHDYEVLFTLLSAGAQADVASRLLDGTGAPVDVASLRGLLSEFKDTFLQWRYLHERTHTEFQEGNIRALILALHASIVALRPEFGPWVGVIQPQPDILNVGR